ncbi:hypothetical protein [Prescottella equi]|uniref:hypothetical protein n=1 Tax=Rhodococcus hoagii TaxID=43767 RepID=UPI001C74CCFC|nr:hypothetical protein [Prescottella equi]BCN43451.1 hypothetical protein RE9414_17310 [Prescottella equi]
MTNFKYRLRQRERVFRFNMDRARALASLARNERIYASLDLEGFSATDAVRDIGLYSVVAAVGSIDELVKSIYCDTIIGYLTNEYLPPNKIKASIPIGAAITLMDAQARGDSVSAGILPTLAQELIFRSNDRVNYQSAAAISGALKELGALKLVACITEFGPGEIAAGDACSLLDKIASHRHVVVHRLGVEYKALDGDTNVSNARAAISADELAAIDEIGTSIVRMFSAFSP